MGFKFFPCLCLALIFGGTSMACSTPSSSAPKTKEEKALAHDKAVCRSEAGPPLGAERNSPDAFRRQALYSRCMEKRGWEAE